MERIKRRLAFISGAILCTWMFGTLGFMIVAGYPLLDAIYMALMTMTTVGYMEVRPLTSIGRIFNTIFILVGVCTIFLAIGAMTQTIIELEFGNYFEKRRIRKMIDSLDGHYIVCGFGRVGRGAAEELGRAGNAFVVIERSEEKVAHALRMGYVATPGDATRDADLVAAGIGRAKGLIAALSTDADNLFVILSAKGLNGGLQISARVLEEGSEQKLRRAGADAVFAPYAITGARLAQAILRPHVVQFLDFATTSLGLNVSIEQIRVAESSEFVSQSLRQAQLPREVGVIVLAIRKADGRMIFNPDADEELCVGDFLIAMGQPEQLRSLEKLMAEARV